MRKMSPIVYNQDLLLQVFIFTRLGNYGKYNVQLHILVYSVPKNVFNRMAVPTLWRMTKDQRQQQGMVATNR